MRTTTRRLLLLCALVLPLATAACMTRSDEPDDAAGLALEESAGPADDPSDAAAPDEGAAADEAGGDAHTELAWFEGSVDEAFAAAEAEGKPLFLYWGAEWCPPCHYLKHAVFKRPEFVAQMAGFVPVYLDGDSERAQIHGERFDVRGYPTVIVFDAGGEEVTRITSGIPVDEYAAVLDAALRLDRPVSTVLAEVLERGPAASDPSDLNLLAYYSWGQDRLVQLPDAERLDTFRRLWEETPETLAVERSRFFTEYMDEVLAQASAAARDAEDEEIPLEEKTAPPLDAAGIAALAEPVGRILSEPSWRRANMGFIDYWSRETVELLHPEPSAEREALIEDWLAATEAIAADESLSVDDRLTASYPMLELAKLRRDAPYVEAEEAGEAAETSPGDAGSEVGADAEAAESEPEAGTQDAESGDAAGSDEADEAGTEAEDAGPPPLPDAVLDRLRAQVRWAGEASADASELQAVMSTMVWLLQEAGLDDEAEALLAARMDDTLAPYYYMSWMASIKSSAEDTDAALDWYRKASDSARGRYSRFRWGSIYLRKLIDYQPEDPEEIERETLRVLEELLQYDDAFALGNHSRLGQLETAILEWNADGSQDETVGRIRDYVAARCDRYAAVDAEAAIAPEPEPDAAADAGQPETAQDDAGASEEVDSQAARCRAFLAAEARAEDGS